MGRNKRKHTSRNDKKNDNEGGRKKRGKNEVTSEQGDDEGPTPDAEDVEQKMRVRKKKGKKEVTSEQGDDEEPIPDADDVEQQMRDTLEEAGIMGVDRVIEYCEEEQMQINEIFDLGSSKEIAEEIGIKKGDAIRLRRCSQRMFKTRTRTLSKTKVHPSNFRLETKYWFSKGSRNLNSPERDWLKEKIKSQLDAQKVHRMTSYHALDTDQAHSYKSLPAPP